MAGIDTTVTANGLRALLNRADELRAKIDSAASDAERDKKVKELDAAVGALARALSPLSQKDFEQLSFSEADKQKLKTLQGLSYVGNRSTRQAMTRVLGGADPDHLGAFSANDDKQGGAPRASGGAINPRTVDQAAAATLTPIVDGKRELEAMHKGLPGVLAAREKLKDDPRVAQLENLLISTRSLADDDKGTGLQAVAESMPAGPGKKEAMSAVAETKKGLKNLAFALGVESTDLVERDKVYAETIAYGLGLPSALTKAQRTKVDELKKAGNDPARIAASTKILEEQGLGDVAKAMLAAAQNPDDPKAQAAMAAALAARGMDPGSAGPGAATGPKTEAEIEAEWNKLKKASPTGYSLMKELSAEKSNYQAKCKSTYQEIMGLLRSGMPIEMIIMLVMLLLTEREEDKLKLKFKEVAAFEQLDKHNEPLRDKLKQLGEATPGEPKAVTDARNAAKDGMIHPESLGMTGKSTTMLMQDLQVAQQMYMQVMQALSAIIRQVQDLVMTPIRNIRS
ncbi:MAG: hypothetical protein HY903_01940 [Deltaproteobacteria bacterium]|nr:hypothetical protein [Deltaproteobacteria bacterium]